MSTSSPSPNFFIPTADNTVLLVGAGISLDAPSGFPVGGEILKTIAAWLGNGDEIEARRALHAMSRRGDHPYAFVRFEQLWQTLELLMKNVSRTMESLQTCGAPNANHFACAEILKSGGGVFTTNFDTHIENAASQLGCAANPWVFNLEGRAPKGKTKYFKLHGSFDDEGDLLSSLFSIGTAGLQFDHIPQVTAQLRETVSGKTLIIAGYSFSDHFDVVPLIENDWSPSQIIWIRYDSENAEPIFRELHATEPLCIPQSDERFELASLARVKHRCPNIHIFEARCANVANTLAGLGLYSGRTTDQVTEGEELYALNIASFENTLEEAGWTPPMKALAIQMLEKRDGFGFHAALDMSIDNEWTHLELPEGFEDEDLDEEDPGEGIYDRVKTIINSDSPEAAMEYFESIERTNALEKSSLYWLSLVQIERELGNLKKAWQLQKNSFNHAFIDEIDEHVSLEDIEILASLDLEYFEYAMRAGDYQFSMELVSSVEERFRHSGAIWIAIEAANARGILIREQLPGRDTEMFEKGQAFAEKAAYFAWRSGRWDAAKTAANELSWYLSVTGKQASAVEILRRTRIVCPDDDQFGFVALTVNIALNEALHLSLEHANEEVSELETRLDENNPNEWIHVLVCRSACAFASGDEVSGLKNYDDARQLLNKLGEDGWGHHAPLNAIAMRFLAQ